MTDTLTLIPCTVTMHDGSPAQGELRVDRAESSYGIPVIVIDGVVYGSADVASYEIDWRYVRRDLHLTQARLADRLDVSVRTVQGWEAGNHTPPLYALGPLFREK
jgi:DNA-binding XRE family transcriptional regulator